MGREVLGQLETVQEAQTAVGTGEGQGIGMALLRVGVEGRLGVEGSSTVQTTVGVRLLPRCVQSSLHSSLSPSRRFWTSCLLVFKETIIITISSVNSKSPISFDFLGFLSPFVMLFDYLIVGGGVIGLSLARILARRGALIGLIEKDTCGAHTSGRNSGVVHAGIYYDPGSAKAKYSVQGNRMLSDFCRARGLPFQNIGKIIAPKHDSQLAKVEDLYRRAKANGADVKVIDSHEAKQIEPRIKQQQKYLWSPNTSIADNKAVIKALKSDCEARKVKIMEQTKYLSKGKETSSTVTIKTSAGDLTTKFLINCAGLYVDSIAHDFGFGLDYAMLPFKGVYLFGNKGIEGYRTLVYPCPVGTNEFLGVHTTNTTKGDYKLGPTAIPIFWKEQYSGLANFNAAELLSILGLYAKCLRSPDRRLYTNLLFREMRKYLKSNLVGDVSAMLERVHVQDYQTWGNPGIFPQLVDCRTGLLKQDFIVETGPQSMHFLNIVSPGWTSALAFTEDMAKRIK